MVSVCSVRNKELGRLGLVILSGPIKRPHIPLHGLVDSCPALYEESHQLHIAAACGNVHCGCGRSREIWVSAEENEESSLAIIAGPEGLQHRVAASLARLQTKRAAHDDHRDKHSPECYRGMFEEGFSHEASSEHLTRHKISDRSRERARIAVMGLQGRRT